MDVLPELFLPTIAVIGPNSVLSAAKPRKRCNSMLRSMPSEPYRFASARRNFPKAC